MAGGYALHWVGWPGKDSPRRWDFNWDLKTEKESDMQHSEMKRNKFKVSRKFIHLSNIFDHTFNMCWMKNWRINESSFSCQEGPSQERWTYGRCHKLRGKLLPFSPAPFHLSNKGLGLGTSIPGLQDLKYSPSKGTGWPSQLFKAMTLQQAKSNLIFLSSQNGRFELCRQGIKRHRLCYH